MAETVMSAAVQLMLKKLATVVGNEFSLITGFKSKLKRLAKTLEMTQAFLDDASQRQVEQAAKLWLKRLEGVAYEADDLFDEFNYEIMRRKIEIGNQMKRKVRMFFSRSNPLVFRSRMAHKINKINMKLKMINEEANTYGLEKRVADSPMSVPAVPETDSVSVDDVIGRENEASKIINTVFNSSSEVISVLPIVGIGGLGKTTLAQKIFNDQQIQNKFDKKIWICVSKNFDSTTLLKKILKSLTKDRRVEVDSRQDIVNNLKDELNGKRYLLVLDDLWNEVRSDWEDFKSSLMGVSATANKGNFVLVTTRSLEVTSIVSPLSHHTLSVLSDDDCWTVIKKIAFSGGEVPQGLEAIGKEIAHKCKGLPLAAKMIGATLQRKKDAENWDSILQSGFSDANSGD